MRKIRIAQIGMNRYSHAPDIFYTLTHLPDIFEVVGYAVVEDERVTCRKKIEVDFAGYPELTLEQILSDPTIEAVAIETDEIHLTKYAQMAAEAGKHIHMEKPGSQDLAAFKKLIETVKKNGKTFHIGYMYRYNPMIADAIERARAGRFGTVYSVEAHMSRLDDREAREWFATFKGGMMFYLGCHLVDIVLQILGKPSEIIPLNTCTGLDGVDSEDLGFAVLKYPNAISVIRMGGTEVGGFSRRQLVICGSKKTAEIRPLEQYVPDAKERYMLYTEKTEFSLENDGSISKTQSKSDAFNRYEGMLLSFGEMVRGEKENPYTADYELSLFEVLLECCGIKNAK